MISLREVARVFLRLGLVASGGGEVLPVTTRVNCVWLPAAGGALGLAWRALGRWRALDTVAARRS